MPFVAPPPIESKRVVVRPVGAHDLADLFEVNSDPEVTALLPYATWTSAADGEAWLRRMEGFAATGLALQFVVVERASGRAIGTCLLFRLEESSARAELGYVLGRAHWGRGLMREALTALLDCAFGRLGLRRIEAEVNVRNAASAALLLRLGFAKEGSLRERWVVRGEPESVDAFGLLRDDWLAAATPDAQWERRVAALWSSLPTLDEADFRARMAELVAELPADDARGAFELGCAQDSTGHSDRAVPLYRAALDGGVDGLRRRRATIQLASSLRNVGRADEAEALLAAERERPADALATAVAAFRALALADLGREREALGHALLALSTHLPRYNASLGRYAAELIDGPHD